MRIESLTPDPAGRVTLRFPNAASRRYTLEFTDNLNAWQFVNNAPLFYPDPAAAQWTDDGTLTGGLGPVRFYRVTVLPP
jgi:hypothetical protein